MVDIPEWIGYETLQYLFKGCDIICKFYFSLGIWKKFNTLKP